MCTITTVNILALGELHSDFTAIHEEVFLVSILMPMPARFLLNFNIFIQLMVASEIKISKAKKNELLYSQLVIND